MNAATSVQVRQATRRNGSLYLRWICSMVAVVKFIRFDAASRRHHFSRGTFLHSARYPELRTT